MSDNLLGMNLFRLTTLLVGWAVAGLFPPQLAWEIHIKVLNGRNGKPVSDECLNISLGAWHGGGLIAPTNKDGIVVLHFDDHLVTADGGSLHACNGMAVLGPRTVPSETDAITIVPDRYVACQEHGKITPGEPANPDLLQKLIPSYSVTKIRESGLATANRCGQFKGEAKSGDLLFFVRPRSLLEGMKD